MPDPVSEPIQPPVEPAAPVQDEPKLQPPSASVEPFDASGTLPPPEQVIPESPHTGLKLIIGFVVVGLIGAGALAFYVMNDYSLSPKKPTSSATVKPAVVSYTIGLEASLQAVDVSLGDLSTNLKDSDTVLSDKQGDLSE